MSVYIKGPLDETGAVKVSGGSVVITGPLDNTGAVKVSSSGGGSGGDVTVISPVQTVSGSVCVRTSDTTLLDNATLCAIPHNLGTYDYMLNSMMANFGVKPQMPYSNSIAVQRRVDTPVPEFTNNVTPTTNIVRATACVGPWALPSTAPTHASVSGTITPVQGTRVVLEVVASVFTRTTTALAHFPVPLFLYLRYTESSNMPVSTDAVVTAGYVTTPHIITIGDNKNDFITRIPAKEIAHSANGDNLDTTFYYDFSYVVSDEVNFTTNLDHTFGLILYSQAVALNYCSSLVFTATVIAHTVQL